MPDELRIWRGEYRHVKVQVRELGSRKFLISVSDGRLTHFHPADDCDADLARELAGLRAAAFARLANGADRQAKHQERCVVMGEPDAHDR
jgi:hypothetical protein